MIPPSAFRHSPADLPGPTGSRGDPPPATPRHGARSTHKAGWKNGKHADQWTATLQTYVYPVFKDKPVAAIDDARVPEVYSRSGRIITRQRGEEENAVSPPSGRMLRNAVDLCQIAMAKDICHPACFRTQDRSMALQRPIEPLRVPIGDAPRIQHSSVRIIGPEETLLLCSDGLGDMVNDNDIAHALSAANDPIRAVRSLAGKAFAAGAQYNVSLIVGRASKYGFTVVRFDPEAAKDIDEINWLGVAMLRAQMDTDRLASGGEKPIPINSLMI